MPKAAGWTLCRGVPCGTRRATGHCCSIRGLYLLCLPPRMRLRRLLVPPLPRFSRSHTAGAACLCCLSRPLLLPASPLYELPRWAWECGPGLLGSSRGKQEAWLWVQAMRTVVLLLLGVVVTPESPPIYASVFFPSTRQTPEPRTNPPNIQYSDATLLRLARLSSRHVFLRSLPRPVYSPCPLSPMYPVSSTITRVSSWLRLAVSSTRLTSELTGMPIDSYSFLPFFFLRSCHSDLFRLLLLYHAKNRHVWWEGNRR